MLLHCKTSRHLNPHRTLEMKINQYLSQANSILNDEGEPFDIGCAPEKLDEYFEEWEDKAGHLKYVTAVKGWNWWDLQLPEDIKIPKNKKPSIIHANTILQTNNHRFDVGHWVRTSLLLTLHNGFIFETENTFYILVGKGSRKTVDPAIAMSFF